MTEYHVGCGIAGIYAGKIRKDKNGNLVWSGKKSDVTGECFSAVVNYLLTMDKRESKGWVDSKTGKEYVLKLEEVTE